MLYEIFRNPNLISVANKIQQDAPVLKSFKKLLYSILFCSTGASCWILFAIVIVDARNHEPEKNVNITMTLSLSLAANKRTVATLIV
jgi:hypothetical protein